MIKKFSMLMILAVALILSGSGLFASLSAKNRVTIPWRDIERIGEDAILVRYIARADEDKKP